MRWRWPPRGPHLTERSSLPVTASGFLGCRARAQSSPSQWPCRISMGLSRSRTITSNISLSWVPARRRSAFQHTLRMERPGKTRDGKQKQVFTPLTNKRKHLKKISFTRTAANAAHINSRGAGVNPHTSPCYSPVPYMCRSFLPPLEIYSAKACSLFPVWLGIIICFYSWIFILRGEIGLYESLTLLKIISFWVAWKS